MSRFQQLAFAVVIVLILTTVWYQISFIRERSHSDLQEQLELVEAKHRYACHALVNVDFMQPGLADPYTLIECRALLEEQ